MTDTLVKHRMVMWKKKRLTQSLLFNLKKAFLRILLGGIMLAEPQGK